MYCTNEIHLCLPGPITLQFITEQACFSIAGLLWKREKCQIEMNDLSLHRCNKLICNTIHYGTQRAKKKENLSSVRGTECCLWVSNKAAAGDACYQKQKDSLFLTHLKFIQHLTCIQHVTWVTKFEHINDEKSP